MYFVDGCKSWRDVITRAAELGYNKFELNVDVPAAWLPDVENSVSAGESRILSVHNYCPMVENLPPDRTIFSAFLITSEDEKERQHAVNLTKKSIDIASRTKASVVVIHSGEVVAKPSGRDLGRFAREFGVKAQLYQSYLGELRKNRRDSSERYLLNAIKSLKEIVVYTETKNVKIALENRFFYHEIPLLDEFGTIFSEINSDMLGMWYDVGHAEIFVRMGFMESHAQLLEPYKKKIFGFHLHDVRGLKDHYAPGEGEIDFSQFFGYMDFNTIKIIEAHPYSAPKAVKNAPLIFASTE